MLHAATAHFDAQQLLGGGRDALHSSPAVVLQVQRHILRRQVQLHLQLGQKPAGGRAEGDETKWAVSASRGAARLLAALHTIINSEVVAWRHFSPLQGLIARFGCASLVDESFGVESFISKRADIRHVDLNGQEGAKQTDRPIAARLSTLVLQNAACMHLNGKLRDEKRDIRQDQAEKYVATAAASARESSPFTVEFDCYHCCWHALILHPPQVCCHCFT